MILIVGLGNPGTKFNNTRHNVGFMAIDEYARKNQFPDFELQKKSESLISEKESVLLAKPQTFMNESGKALQKLSKNLFVVSLIVIHDDIDLPIGKIKIVQGRGSAGHKGVESIIKSIGNDNLIRIRIGIAGANKTKAMKVVLKKFSENEQKTINEVISKIPDAIDMLIKDGLEKAMNEFNK